MLPLPIGADYAVIVGAKEVEAGMVTLRDMQTREQEMMGFEDAVVHIINTETASHHETSYPRKE